MKKSAPNREKIGTKIHHFFTVRFSPFTSSWFKGSQGEQILHVFEVFPGIFENTKAKNDRVEVLYDFSPRKSQEWPRQTKSKKGQFMNFSRGHSGKQARFSGKEKHININKFVGLSRDWVGAKKLFMCFFRVIPYGGGKTHKQNSPKNPGTIPWKFCLRVLFFMCFFRSLDSMWIVLVFLRKHTRIHKNGRNSWELFVLALSLVWFAGATPEKGFACFEAILSCKGPCLYWWQELLLKCPCLQLASKR